MGAVIRILHFADLHLGVETYGRPDPATGLSTRLLDFLRAFDELVDFAIEEQVDVVLANLRIASHADVSKLERKVAQLNKKVRELEKQSKQVAA